MGLHLCYELSRPGETSEAVVAEQLADLRQHALALPFDGVSQLVRLDHTALAGPWPLRGLVYERLEDVVHVCAVHARRELYRRSIGISDDDEFTRVDVPNETRTLALGFAVAPGRGSEPASFGLATLCAPALPWSWHHCCKTQYASRFGDDHLVRCHGSLVELLDAARKLGFDVVVRDETGYWASRDRQTLVDSVTRMNRIVAQLAGTLTDAVREAGGDSRQVQGAIFEDPDFERLETKEE